MPETFSRRALLNLTGLNVAWADGPAGPSQYPPGRDVLISVFLRGGCDGLNLVTPIAGDDRRIYEEERPTLKMPLDGPQGLLKLDSGFGLHPAAKPLFDLFQAQKLAVVHGAGLPSNTRSHFDAQNIIELGMAEKKVLGTGWLARYLESTGANTGTGGAISSTSAAVTQLPALSVGGLEPTSLLSFNQSVVVNDPKGMNLLNDKNAQQDQIDALRRIYQRDNSWMSAMGNQVLHTMDLLNSRASNDYVPAKNVEYPKGELGNRLKVLAQILKMDLGVRVATVDYGGWDTHKYQGVGTDGQFSKQVQQLAEALAAFYSDMNESGADSRGKRLTVVVMTEFGRRLRENANRGTDHGHGGVMMVLGENINGGKIYGKWPGLKTEELYERADLAVTTDYRTVLSEVLQKRLKVSNTSKIFPEFKFARPLGLARA